MAQTGNTGVVRWAPGVEVIKSGLERYGDAVFDGVEHLLLGYADSMRSYMKANHRWQNQTGAAERGLDAFVERFDWGVALAIVNSVWYGGIIEAREDLGIIAPTMEIFGPRILADLQDLAS